MRPLIINTFDRGGAANAAIRLHLGLQKLDIKSNVLLKYKTRDILKSHEHIENIRGEKSILKKMVCYKTNNSKRNTVQKILNYQNSRDSRLEYFSSPFSNLNLPSSEHFKNSNVINLHWVSDFIDWSSFFKNISKPMVWTLHDQNPFLGGEHYCEKYIGMDRFGYPVNRKYTQYELDLEKRLIEYKLQCIKDIKNLHVVSPSHWLLGESKKSQILGRFEHSHVPNGFPIDIFKYQDKKHCRENLNIPINKRVILFVSDSIKNERKGIKYLIGALNQMKDSLKKEIICCVVGGKLDFEIDNSISLIELGQIVDEKHMSMIYSAADLFVLPSLIDNSPNTVIESLLCGTPVVAFNVGGVQELIQNEKNGILTLNVSVRDLKESIETFLFDGVEWGDIEISNSATKKYALEIQAEIYKNLYSKILTND